MERFQKQLIIHSFIINEYLFAGFCIHMTGHMKLCLISVLKYDAVVHGKIRECSTDVLIRQLFIQNNTSHDETEQ
jgi:hypothetical protein